MESKIGIFIVWTCIWTSGLVLGCLECIQTYMDIYGHIPALSGWSMLPAALRQAQKIDDPGFVQQYFVNLVDVHGFEASQQVKDQP
jgi:hypothetical protein